MKTGDRLELTFNDAGHLVNAKWITDNLKTSADIAYHSDSAVGVVPRSLKYTGETNGKADPAQHFLIEIPSVPTNPDLAPFELRYYGIDESLLGDFNSNLIWWYVIAGISIPFLACAAFWVVSKRTS